ncbi:SH3 domain-containing protein, partial [Nitrospinaceae bacterium]|nr:SH3 domain-containing protein [Nitrospinaceae bacterium]
MASSLRLILSPILFLSLSASITSGHAKTSTENLIVNKSDILEAEKSTGIEEGNFFEDIQINSDEYVWLVNLKKGPFPNKEKANQAALELKKTLGITLPKLPKKILILQKSKSANNKNLNQAKFSWMINLSLGVYDSKGKALQIAQELKVIQKVPENVFLTRETKDIKTSKFAENITPEISGQIFLSREAKPIKDKTKYFILVTTKSNSLNVRKNPSSSSPVVARLLRGSKVPHIKNSTLKNRGSSWFYIEYSKGKFGWVSSSYSKEIIDSVSRTTQQAILKTVKPKNIKTSEALRTSKFRELK